MRTATRRAFLGSVARLTAGGAGMLAIPPTVGNAAELDTWLSEQRTGSLQDQRPDDVVARDESYWSRIRRLYSLQRDVVNLDNGWTNPAPSAAVEELVRGARKLEGLPAEHLPGMWEQVSTTMLRAALASAMNVAGFEIALLRNATEALDTVLLGHPLRAGDEVVCSVHDYYAMLDALEQRRARDGIVLRIISPTIPAASLEAIEALYAEAIGQRTRLVLLTHPSNLTGQLLPVRRIADRAHAAGAVVVVDGAQSLGLLEDPVRSLGCDYYGASAHKWLGTPVGLGVLWMRPEHVNGVWPLLPPMANEKGMARFEWIGTAPEYINVASIPALALHARLGAGRKAARLRYLASLVRERVRRAVPDATFYAAAPDMTFGLTTFQIGGVDSAKLRAVLREKYRILVQAMTDIRSDSRIRGIRVSPNVYATPAEIERFGTACGAESAKLRT